MDMRSRLSTASGRGRGHGGQKGTVLRFAREGIGRSSTDLEYAEEDVSTEELTAMEKVRVSVVIPTLNEARNLPYVFAELPAGLHEVIVVDGFSTDGTVDVARKLMPEVRIVLQDRR